jgi:hypothetical protein
MAVQSSWLAHPAWIRMASPTATPFRITRIRVSGWEHPTVQVCNFFLAVARFAFTVKLVHQVTLLIAAKPPAQLTQSLTQALADKI